MGVGDGRGIVDRWDFQVGSARLAFVDELVMLPVQAEEFKSDDHGLFVVSAACSMCVLRSIPRHALRNLLEDIHNLNLTAQETDYSLFRSADGTLPLSATGPQPSTTNVVGRA